MSKISNISGVPKYRQLLNKLTASISSGEYPVGSQMPTETEVMMKFGVSRITVRNAMQHLESEGLIKRESGRGTFVLDDKKKTDSNSHIAFILIDVDQGDLFHFREIQLMERYLSSHGIPFSWAILT